jgi:L-alanine-DL-glutamate epimerase-like enolase superfamily enzyme
MKSTRIVQQNLFQELKNFSDLKITRICAYQVDLPLKEKSYKWAGGKSVSSFDATVVRIETNHGIIGHGETTPLGSNYLPAYAEGVRAGLQVVGRPLIGLNPLSLNNINSIMDRTLKGHPYVKAALDVACWDIIGKVAGLPVCELR